MIHKPALYDIIDLNTILSTLQTHSNKFKNSFFDYIEGLNSEYKIFSKYIRDDFSFEIYGNKLKLKATYNTKDTPFFGDFSAIILNVENEKDKYIDFLSWKFDTSGNMRNAEENQFFTVDDFDESFFIEIMTKLIKTNKFEL